jgi:hypothetical protein
MSLPQPAIEQLSPQDSVRIAPLTPQPPQTQTHASGLSSNPTILPPPPISIAAKVTS